MRASAHLVSASTVRRPGDPALLWLPSSLSTGTTGAEGTLGGLVEQVAAIFASTSAPALTTGRALFVYDPVLLASHSPDKDHAERWLEGAACHGCLFLAECACEWFNCYLDRALVFPVLGCPSDLAFFRERP